MHYPGEYPVTTGIMPAKSDKRVTLPRSISFNPQVFELMEARRKALCMDRTEYVHRLILKDLNSGLKFMEMPEMPPPLQKVDTVRKKKSASARR